MWYFASLFFQSVHNDCPTDHDVWEQRVFLLQSPTAADAQIQAAQIGKESEHHYISVTGDRVHWVFRHVESISELFEKQLKPGTEVYWRFLKGDEVSSLLKPFDDGEDNFGGDKR
jgi:hypothetical protein